MFYVSMTEYTVPVQYVNKSPEQTCIR